MSLNNNPPPTFSNFPLDNSSGNSRPISNATNPNWMNWMIQLANVVSPANLKALFASPYPIGSTTPNTGAFTTLSASSSITGSTLTATGGLITPSYPSGIQGVTSGAAINGGSIGETATAQGTSINVPTGTITSIAQLTLTAGNWIIVGNVLYVPAGGASMSNSQIFFNTSASTPGTPFIAVFGPACAGNLGIPAPIILANIGSNVTYHVYALTTFAAGSVSANGYITASRIS